MLPLTEKGRVESPESVTAGALMPPIDLLLLEEDDDEDEPEFPLPAEEDGGEPEGEASAAPPLLASVAELIAGFAWDPLLLSCPAWFCPFVPGDPWEDDAEEGEEEAPGFALLGLLFAWGAWDAEDWAPVFVFDVWPVEPEMGAEVPFAVPLAALPALALALALALLALALALALLALPPPLEIVIC